MSDYYDLAGQKVSREAGLSFFSDAHNEQRQIGYEKRGGIRVSTVFLVIDHSWGDGPPLIFETMIFGGPHDEFQERYSTRAQAEEGHVRACALAFNGMDEQ